MPSSWINQPCPSPSSEHEAEARARQGQLTKPAGSLGALEDIAITLAAGIKAAGALTNNAERMVDVSAAQWCADNQLAALKLSATFPGVGDSDFSCTQLGREYRGKLVVRPTPNPNFRRVDTQLSNPDGQPLLTLSTVLPRY